MSRESLDIELEGVELSVTGEYTKGVASRITADPYTSEEGYGPSFEVQSVMIGNIDVTNLLDFCLDDIAEKAIEILTI